MLTPTTRQRKALQCLAYQEWEYAAQINGAGAKTIGSLLENGWIEPFVSEKFVDGLHNRYRITELGRRALSAPSPKKSKAKPSLRTLPSRLKTLPLRF